MEASLDPRFHTPGWAEKRLKEIRQEKERMSSQYEAPLPESTLRNADGTPYQAGGDPGIKRFLLTIKGKTIEGVIFSDGTIVIHGEMFQACTVTEADIKRMLPDAWIQRLD